MDPLRCQIHRAVNSEQRAARQPTGKPTAGLVPHTSGCTSPSHQLREGAKEGVVAGEGFEPSTFGL